MNLPGFSAEAALKPSRSFFAGAAAFPPASGAVHPTLPCIHGRWCGPGCSGPGAPTDNVDACCKVHDDCYTARGYLACSCDWALLRCLAPKINFWTGKGRAALAASTYFGFAVSRGLCNPFA